tara:strand:+ start:273 stop:479 length:207 start_codon:yes stop_codon:yes gene_type:complete
LLALFTVRHIISINAFEKGDEHEDRHRLSEPQRDGCKDAVVPQGLAKARINDVTGRQMLFRKDRSSLG